MAWWDKIVSFFSGASSAVSGVGAIAGAVTEGEKLAGQVVGEVHDHNENVAGQNKVLAETNAESAQVNHDVAEAAVAATDASSLGKLLDGRA